MLQTKKAAAEACGVEKKKKRERERERERERDAAQISREAAAVTGDSLEVLLVQICAVLRMAIVAFVAFSA